MKGFPKTSRKLDPDGLTLKERAFILEFIKDWNGAEAVKRAGYTGKNARRVADTMLRKELVQKVVRKESAKYMKKLDINAEKVLQEVARIAFSKFSDVADVAPDGKVTIKNWDEIDTSLISEIGYSETANGKNVKVKLHSKDKNLEMLMRHFGLFLDKAQLEMTGGVNVIFDIPRPDDKELWAKEKDSAEEPQG